jgi:chemotaxis protein methyltransferase CheR
MDKIQGMFPPSVLSADDKKKIFSLAETLTGSCQQGNMQKDVLLMNIIRRMRFCSSANLDEYLKHANIDHSEHAQLVSALTIHTTSWYRESPHYDVLKDEIKLFIKRHRSNTGRFDTTFYLWCAACSTGEEVYSFATILEKARQENLGFEYKITGSDIDSVSLETAKKCIYPLDSLKDVPAELKRFFLFGTGKTEGFFTLSKEIRQRCSFQKLSLSETASLKFSEKYHFIVCRNVLIYFEQTKVKDIITALVNNLIPSEGALCLGHSESVSAQEFNLELVKNSVYKISAVSNIAKKKNVYQMPQWYPEAILVGASTGGNEALMQLLGFLPRGCPPVVVVQHISHSFSLQFAQRLAAQSQLKLGKFESGTELENGHLYMSCSDAHICLRRSGKKLTIYVNTDEAVMSHRPSVDKLFFSAASSNVRCFAFLLTGMGKDGALGLLELHNQGNYTCAQSEASCVVFGMPKEALRLNAVNFVGDLYTLRKVIEDIYVKRI